MCLVSWYWFNLRDGYDISAPCSIPHVCCVCRICSGLPQNLRLPRAIARSIQYLTDRVRERVDGKNDGS